MRHLRLYQAIRAIVKTGSIRKASEYQRISPSALNRSILAFEDEIGVEIFERLPSGVRLSTAGELLYYHLEDHLARMSDFSELLAEMKGLQTGRLRLSVSADLTQTLLPQVLQAFRTVHAAITVDVVSCETSDKLLERDVDLALVTQPETDAGVTVALFHQARIEARISHDAPKDVIALSDIPDHALILPPLGSGLRSKIDLAMRRFDVTPGATHVYPGLLPNLSAATPADLQFVLDFGTQAAFGATARPAQIEALRLDPVQVTLLKRSDGVLPRTAERFVTILQAYLDGLDP